MSAMSMKDVADMIAETKLPNAYYEFPDDTEQAPPFICFFYPTSTDIFADNSNFVSKRRLVVELYTNNKDVTQEAVVEDVLKTHDLTFAKGETYIASERMYQVVYEMEAILS